MFNLLPFSTNEPSVFDYFNALDHYMSSAPEKTISQFRADITESEDNFILTAELPGFEKDEINIKVSDDVLTISATHKAQESNEETEKNEEEAKEEAKVRYIRKELHTCDYSRSFNVDGIDQTAIKAGYNNGMLTVTLPKVTPKEPTKIEIGVA